MLVLDYDPRGGSPPVAQSLSTNLAVIGVKVTEAPGAATDEEGPRNDKMYVLETTTMPEEQYVSFRTERMSGSDGLPSGRLEDDEEVSAQSILTKFKQRSLEIHLHTKR